MLRFQMLSKFLSNCFGIIKIYKLLCRALLVILSVSCVLFFNAANGCDRFSFCDKAGLSRIGGQQHIFMCECLSKFDSVKANFINYPSKTITTTLEYYYFSDKALFFNSGVNGDGRHQFVHTIGKSFTNPKNEFFFRMTSVIKMSATGFARSCFSARLLRYSQVAEKINKQEWNEITRFNYFSNKLDIVNKMRNRWTNDKP